LLRVVKHDNVTPVKMETKAGMCVNTVRKCPSEDKITEEMLALEDEEMFSERVPFTSLSTSGP
jgi:hypothetical protein